MWNKIRLLARAVNKAPSFNSSMADYLKRELWLLFRIHLELSLYL